VTLQPPTGLELPAESFILTARGFVEPPASGAEVNLDVADGSERLQLLEPFVAIADDELQSLPLLLKARGKCTTDHISPAGVWLKYRGHLQNISDNSYTGATNAFTDEQGHGTNVFTGETGVAFPELAKDYRGRGTGWVAIGDVNYGEGSSREHAAMCPRWLGARVVIAKGFARIAETNLKKQGVLALTFEDPADWEKVAAEDRLSFGGVDTLAPGSTVTMTATHADGSSDTIRLAHSYSELQVDWFRAGSALNYLRLQGQEAALV